MMGRKSIFMIIFGMSLIIGALTFLIYKSIFSNSILALVVAVATAIFVCIMAELTILDLAVRMLAQRRQRLIQQLKRDSWWSNMSFRAKPKIVEATISPVLDSVIEGKHCPHCGSKKLKKRRMKINSHASYRCQKCGWRGEEFLLLKKWRGKKTSEAETSP